MRLLMERLRFVFAGASILLAVTTVVTIVWAGASSVDLVRNLLHGGWRTDQAVADLLNIIDLVLLASVELIIAVGLYELFVQDLRLPDWLTINDIRDLKRSLSEALVLVLAIKFFERLLVVPPRDALFYAGSVALVTAVLVAFNAVRPSH